MSSTPKNSALERQYWSLIGSLAESCESDSGYPLDLESLCGRRDLTGNERAAIIEHHGANFSNELSIDTDLLAAYVRDDIGAVEMLRHIRDATIKACWSVIALDLNNRWQDRADEIRRELSWAV